MTELGTLAMEFCLSLNLLQRQWTRAEAVSIGVYLSQLHAGAQLGALTPELCLSLDL